MKRRDDDLDSLVLDDAQAVQEVLLGGPVGRRQSARRGATEPVDELVDPRRAKSRRGRAPGQELAPRQAQLRPSDRPGRAPQPPCRGSARPDGR